MPKVRNFDIELSNFSSSYLTNKCIEHTICFHSKKLFYIGLSIFLNGYAKVISLSIMFSFE